MDSYEWIGTILGSLVLAGLLLWLAPVLGLLILWVSGLSLAWLLIRWVLYRYF